MHGGLDVQGMGGDTRELAEPLGPEQERGGRAEAQDEDEATLPVSAKLTSVPHFAISMPNGATNMIMMPAIMKRARRGMRSNMRSMSSMSRLPI